MQTTFCLCAYGRARICDYNKAFSSPRRHFDGRSSSDVALGSAHPSLIYICGGFRISTGAERDDCFTSRGQGSNQAAFPAAFISAAQTRKQRFLFWLLRFSSRSARPVRGFPLQLGDDSFLLWWRSRRRQREGGGGQGRDAAAAGRGKAAAASAAEGRRGEKEEEEESRAQPAGGGRIIYKSAAAGARCCRRHWCHQYNMKRDRSKLCILHDACVDEGL